MSYFPWIQPDASHRIAIRSTLRNRLGQNIMATRKEFETTHEIKYTFEKLSNRQHRIIDNHNASMDGGVTSFNVVDWGEPKVVKAINSKGYITLNNVKNFSVNSGDGGNRICLWSNSGDYGNDSTVSANILTDRTKAWTAAEWQNHKIMDTNGTVFNASTNTANTITVPSANNPYPGAYDIFRYEDFTISAINVASRILTLSASPVMTFSAWNQFVMPVYECYYLEDRLDGLDQTGEFNRESSDSYGPFHSGEIVFMQKGSG